MSSSVCLSLRGCITMPFHILSQKTATSRFYPANTLIGKVFSNLSKQQQFHTSNTPGRFERWDAHTRDENLNAISVWATIFSSGEKIIQFSGRRWLQGDWTVLPSGCSCLPRTAGRRLTDSGSVLRREGVSCCIDAARKPQSVLWSVLVTMYPALYLLPLWKKIRRAHLPVQQDKRHIIHDLNPPDNGIALKVNAATSCSLPTPRCCRCLGSKHDVAAWFFN